MTWTMTVEETKYQQPEPKPTVGRCYQIIDLGTSIDDRYDNAKEAHRVYLRFELPSQTLDDGRPMSVGKTYGIWYGERAKWQMHMSSWRGRKLSQGESFDLEGVLGQCALLDLKENKQEKTVIEGVMRVPPEMKEPDPFNQKLLFRLDQFDRGVFDGLPDWAKEHISKSNEFKALENKATAQEIDEDVPF